MQDDKDFDFAENGENDFEKALEYVASDDAKASAVLKIFEKPSIRDSFEKKREILQFFERRHPEQRNGIEILRKWVYHSFTNESYSEVMRLTPIRLTPAKKSAETHGFVGKIKKLAEKLVEKYNLF